MNAIFLKIINLSLNASWLILVVIVARLLLKKTPKWISCLLWGLVAIRLLCPLSIESALSLLPSGRVIPADIETMQDPHINTGVMFINNTVNPVIEKSLSPEAASSVNPMQVVVYAGSVIWVAGMAAMLIYALISYVMLKKKVKASVAVDDRVRECDEVRSPFILGILHPVIYFPSGMSGETLKLVLAHEKAHLRRHDHWWKPFGFMLLAVYWFNPLCWIAYALLCRDIEAACDEKVISDKDRDYVASYSQALLDCSAQRRVIAACPVAFGETGVKGRIKGVLNYKRPAFWVIVAALIVCIVVAVCFMTDPKKGEAQLTEESVGLQELAGAEENPGMQEQKNTEANDVTEGKMVYYYSGNKSEGKDMINFSIRLNEDGTYTWYETPFSSFIGMGSYTIDEGYLYMTDDEEMTGIPRTNIFRMEGDRLYYVSEGSSNFAYVKLEDGEEFVLWIDPYDEGIDLTEDTGNLVFRNYGDNAVHADEGSIINISIKNDLNYLDSIYVGNCRTGEEVKLPVLRTVSYKVEESGDYYAYAVTVEGSFADLSDSIGITHSYSTQQVGGKE